MFGFVAADLNTLSDEEKLRYRSVYCGLCRTLGKRHGALSRLALSYDLTFLILFFSSLYEPDEAENTERCLIHPLKIHNYTVNCVTEYAADMTVLLAYHKALDDWNDDRSAKSRAYAAALKSAYKKVSAAYPQQSETIERCISELTAVEKGYTYTGNDVGTDCTAGHAKFISGRDIFSHTDHIGSGPAGKEAAKAPAGHLQKQPPDKGASLMGELLASVFAYKDDIWLPYARAVGYGLGAYIYLADAWTDYEDDLKCGRPNPLFSLTEKPDDIRPYLMSVLGNASAALEMLPLVRDAHLVRNIFYSGIWMRINNEENNT